jgi:hypothetical protein
MKLFILLFSLFLPSSVLANPLLCPVCTFAVAGGLGLARFFGVRDEVMGVWIGAALLAFVQWTVYYFEKKNPAKLWVKILCYIGWYSVLIPLYLGKRPKILFNYNRILGADSFLVSVAAGSLAAVAGAKLYEYLKLRNGGKAHFSYEKVLLPLVMITLVSCLFHFGYKI